MATLRQLRLFRHGRNQAVHIPLEFELPGDEVTIRREGRALILEPVRRNMLREVLETLEPIHEDFPEIDDPPVEPEDIFRADFGTCWIRTLFRS